MNSDLESSTNSTPNWSIESGQQLITATLDQLSDGEIVVLAMNIHIKILDDTQTIRERVFRYYMRKYCGDTAASWNIELDEDEDSPRLLAPKPLPRTIITSPQFSHIQRSCTFNNDKPLTEENQFNINRQDPKVLTMPIPNNRRVRISQQTIEYSPGPREDPHTFTGNLINLEDSQQVNNSEESELDETIFPQEDIEESNSLKDQVPPRNTNNVTFRKPRPNPTNATSSPTIVQNPMLQNTTTNNYILSPIRHDTKNLQSNHNLESIPPPQRSQIPSMSNTNQTWRISDVPPHPSVLTSTQHPMSDPSLVRLTDITDFVKDISLNKTKRPKVKTPNSHVPVNTAISNPRLPNVQNQTRSINSSNIDPLPSALPPQPSPRQNLDPPSNLFTDIQDFTSKANTYKFAKESRTFDLLNKWQVHFKGNAKRDPEEFIARLLSCYHTFELNHEDIIKCLPSVLDSETLPWY